MQIVKTNIDGLVLLKPHIYKDFRGYFMESFKLDFFNKYFPDINFIQENESQTNFGVLRGLHFQKNPHWQSKLVRVVEGKVQDVVVDLRKDSLTFGKYQSFILSSENKHQLFIPKGLAHGFLPKKKQFFNTKLITSMSHYLNLGFTIIMVN